MSDGWTDIAKRALINLMVSSAGGVVFERSIDTPGSQKTGEYIAKALLEIIHEVGVENVVQVITDNAANCKLACHLVKQTYSEIFWTPCGDKRVMGCMDKGQRSSFAHRASDLIC
ncbi:hypothetical protein L7F22_031118 [Adiantum nelumboides]|nr:hypothetical protein [Adiantum nelumboides]